MMNAEIRARIAREHPRLLKLSGSPEPFSGYLQGVQHDVAAHPASVESRQLLHGAMSTACSSLPERIKDLLPVPSLIPSVVSFAEHHASISHPESTNVVANLATYMGGEGSSVLSLTCGTTPLDNELFPRGVVVGDTRVPLMSNRQRRMSVTTARAFDVQDAGERLHHALKMGCQSKEQVDAIQDWFESLAPNIQGMELLWEQITVMNLSLAHQMFEGGGLTYFSVPMEIVAKEILIHWLSSGDGNWLTEALCHRSKFDELVRTLDGVPGFFSIGRKKGTVLVWRNQNGRLLPVGLDDVAPSSSRTGDWLERLIDGTYVPSAGLSMLVISFVLGFANFGGLLQYDYLAKARQSLLKSDSLLNKEETDALSFVPDSFYVNFEERPTTDGGLLRVHSPIDWLDLALDMRASLKSHTADCIEWLASSYSKRPDS